VRAACQEQMVDSMGKMAGAPANLDETNNKICFLKLSK